MVDEAAAAMHVAPSASWQRGFPARTAPLPKWSEMFYQKILGLMKVEVARMRVGPLKLN
jgi:hypothetical protein